MLQSPTAQKKATRLVTTISPIGATGTTSATAPSWCSTTAAPIGHHALCALTTSPTTSAAERKRQRETCPAKKSAWSEALTRWPLSRRDHMSASDYDPPYRAPPHVVSCRHPPHPPTHPHQLLHALWVPSCKTILDTHTRLSSLPFPFAHLDTPVVCKRQPQAIATTKKAIGGGGSASGGGDGSGGAVPVAAAAKRHPPSAHSSTPVMPCGLRPPRCHPRYRWGTAKRWRGCNYSNAAAGGAAGAGGSGREAAPPAACAPSSDTRGPTSNSCPQNTYRCDRGVSVLADWKSWLQGQVGRDQGLVGWGAGTIVRSKIVALICVSVSPVILVYCSAVGPCP